jgi:hypothetical protein
MLAGRNPAPSSSQHEQKRPKMRFRVKTVKSQLASLHLDLAA